MNYANDNDKHASEWLRQIPIAIAVDERSIKDVKGSDLDGFTQCHFFAGIGGWPLALQIAGWPEGREVWTGSCPCQPFSAAGKRKGTGDERHLWPEFRRLIAECRPATIFGEQVASKAGRAWLSDVRSDLEALGYAVGAADLCAAGAGAPHIRQRLFWVANAAEPRHARTRERPAINRERQDSLSQRGNTLVESSGSCSVSGLADAASSSGPQQQREPREGSRRKPGPQDAAERGASCGGMVHTSNGRIEGRSEPIRRIASVRLGEGFWGECDFLYCSDGKYRPVEPSHVIMVDGIPGNVDNLLLPITQLGTGDETQRRSEEDLQGMRGADAAEDIERTLGGFDDVQEEKVLQSGLHGGEHGRRDQGEVRPEQQEAGGKNGPKILHDLRPQQDSPACSSYRREPAEQRSFQLDDIVRFLPSSYSLAKLHGRRQDEAELSLLFRAIGEEANVQYAPQQVEEVWASLSEKAKGRVRMGFDASRWGFVAPFPLAHDAQGRVAQLRGLGNSIVPQVAAEFVAAFMETL